MQNFISTTGIDSNKQATQLGITSYINDEDYGSIEKPFRTVKKALAHASPGDTLYMRAGEYPSQNFVNRDGEEDIMRQHIPTSCSENRYRRIMVSGIAAPAIIDQAIT